ncbi:pseudouridine synthase [Bacillus horti]|uniref:Pseudouridine synthase n=1 Tax=Caldalkalibacillus horti TaxID=77523 RepID=A0ABT9VX84_9BACI|nr:pseudouridine synthase [Bacillus horti]MDQ0165422.1 16S rRNA pseudouridine516 synthase [Bacillus horti]
MRIDKLLANMGYGSRKEIKDIVRAGQVTVNGVVIKDVKQHVQVETDRVEYAGELIEYKEHVYFMLHKPQGVISATEDTRERTVIDLLQGRDKAFSVFPVGRLDKDTEGLLLLTNDGQLAHQLLSPKKHIPKLYFAHIEGTVTEEDKLAFADGVTLDDGYKTMPAELNILRSDSRSEIELTIMEGKFHQVKRMFLARGKKVTYLKRMAMGTLHLDGELLLGHYRELTNEELELLKKG